MSVEEDSSRLNDLASSDSLLRAWAKSRVYASSNDFFSFSCEWRELEAFLMPNLLALCHRLMSGEYKPRKPITISVPRGDGQIPRKLCMMHPIDQVVSQAILDEIGPELDRELSENVLGHRLATGVDGHRYVFQHWIAQYSNFVSRIDDFSKMHPDKGFFKIDVKSFYPSVSVSDTLAILRGKVGDNQLVNVLELILTAYESLDKETSGLAQGPPLSHLLANMYLGPIDDFLEERSLDYARYVDDVVAVFPSEDVARQALSELDSLLDDLGLRRNLNKSEVGKVSELSGVLDVVAEAKYLVGVQLTKDLSEETKREALEAFDQLFIEVADVLGLDSVHKHVRSFLRVAIHRHSKENLLSFIYDLIESVHLRPQPTQALMMTLLEITQQAIPEHFGGLLLRLPTSSKLAFLNSLRETGIQSGEVEEIVMSYSSDGDALVRATAIEILSENDTLLKQENLIDISLHDESKLVRKRALYALAREPQQTMFDSLIAFAETGDIEAGTAVLNVLNILDDSDLTQRILARARIDWDSHELLVYLAHLTFRAPTEHLVTRLLRHVSPLSSEFSEPLIEQAFVSAQGDALKTGNLALVRQLADIPRFATQWPAFGNLLLRRAILAYSSLPAQGIRSMGDEEASALGEILASQEGISLEDRAIVICDRFEILGSYGMMISNQCMHFRARDRMDGKNCVLELFDPDFLDPDISIELLGKQLREFTRANLTNFLGSCQISMAGKTYAVFAYGLQLGESLYSDDFDRRTPLEETEAVSLLLGCVSTLMRLDGGTIEFVRLSGYDIVGSIQGQIKVINFVSQLSEPRAYPCLNEPRIILEHTPRSLSSSLGLFAFEIVSGEGPMKTAISMGQHDIWQARLSDSKALARTSRLFRRFVLKCMYQTLSYRYESLKSVTEDLEHILDTQEKLALLELEHGRSIRVYAELLDFLSFDLKNRIGLEADKRNGLLAHDDLRYLVSRTLQHLQSLDAGIESSTPDTFRGVPPSKSTISLMMLQRTYPLSLATQRLVLLAAQIDLWIRRLNQVAGLGTGHALPNSLMLLAARTEIIAMTRALLHTYACCLSDRKVFTRLTHDSMNSLKTSMAEDEKETTCVSLKNKEHLFTLQDIEGLLQGIDKFSTAGFEDRGSELTHPRLLRLLWTLHGAGCLVATTPSQMKSMRKGLSLEDLDRMLVYLEHVESLSVGRRVALDLDKVTEFDRLRKSVLGLANIRPKSNSYRRNRAVLGYHSILQSGEVGFGLPQLQLKTRRFRRADILRTVRGDNPVEGQNATVDFLKEHGSISTVIPDSQVASKLMHNWNRLALWSESINHHMSTLLATLFVTVVLLFGLISVPDVLVSDTQGLFISAVASPVIYKSAGWVFRRLARYRLKDRKLWDVK